MAGGVVKAWAIRVVKFTVIVCLTLFGIYVVAPKLFGERLVCGPSPVPRVLTVPGRDQFFLEPKGEQTLCIVAIGYKGLRQDLGVCSPDVGALYLQIMQLNKQQDDYEMCLNMGPVDFGSRFWRRIVQTM